MKQEEKQLLLKDLCGRLPYGVICKIIKSDNPFIRDNKLDAFWFAKVMSPWYDIKPYLRPMSSMTEEERDEFRNLGGVMSHNVQNDSWALSAFSPEAYDWLFAHHFDIHDLIKKDLALEAPEGMYE